MTELKKWMIRRAVEEIAESMEEFTQYDLYALLKEWLGRELTPGEKQRATKYIEKNAELKEVRRDPETKVRIYIFYF